MQVSRALLLALPLALATGCSKSESGKDGKSSGEAVAGETGGGGDENGKGTGDGASVDAEAPDPVFAELKIVEPPKGSAVTIGGEPLDLSELKTRLDLKVASVAARREEGEVNEKLRRRFAAEITAQLLWSELLERESQRLGVDYDPEELKKAEAAERKDIRDWSAWLESQGQTEAIRHQLNVDYYREQALLRSLGSIEATDAEVDEMYANFREASKAPMERVRASHLLFAVGPRNPGERIQPLPRHVAEAASEEDMKAWDALALERARAMRTRALEEGVDFNELAREVSEGPGRSRGGDMGLFPKRQMDPPYAEAAFSQKAGETSEPVRGRMGWYVIRTYAKIPADTEVPKEHLRPDLVRMIESHKKGTLRYEFRTGAVKRYDVKSPFLDSQRLLTPGKPAALPDPKGQPTVAPNPDPG